MQTMRRDCYGDRKKLLPGSTVERSFEGREGKTMDRKQLVRMALGLAGVGAVMLAMRPLALAQKAAGAAAAAAEKGTFLTTRGAGWLGGAIGAGLAIMGGAAGIGRIGRAGVASMARAPGARGA